MLIPVEEARSVGLDGCVMPDNSHGANCSSSLHFRMVPNERRRAGSYHPNMVRRTSQTGAPKGPAKPDWYLRQWMKTLRVTQTQLARECDWNTSTMHGIYHGRTEYYREILNLIAVKLNVQPYELLMHPDEAMAIRQLLVEANKISDIGRGLQVVNDRTGTQG